MSLGHFIDYETWKQAVDLLNFQINHKKTNKSYNNLNFHYFSKISSKVRVVRTREFYTSRIENSLFYGLQNEFFFEHHTVPKSGMGLRKYFFFSYPMQCLYYAIGIYILKVSYQLQLDSRSPKINSFYGGDVKWVNNTLLYDKQSVYYQKYHTEFKRKVGNLLNTKKTNRSIIQLDIQNYFDELSIARLLKLIGNYAKPSELKKYNYDELTQELIQFFFMYLHGDNLPQSNNNIFSGYIGYFYLIFGDLIIDDLVNSARFKDKIENYEIVRYVDDVYLSIDLLENTKEKDVVSENEENQLIFNLLHDISDHFYYKLGLRFNSKTSIYKTRKAKDRESLRKNINKDYQFVDADSLRLLTANAKNIASKQEPNAHTDTKKSKKNKSDKTIEDALPVPQKADLLLTGIEELSKLTSVDLFSSKQEKIIDKLKYAYDDQVGVFLDQEKIREQLDEMLDKIEPMHLKVAPKPLMSLFLRSLKSEKKIKQLVESINILNTYSIDILLTYLSMTDFKNKKIFDRLKESDHYRSIVEKFYDPYPVNSKLPGYYKLSISQLKPLLTQHSFIEQVRLRAYNEKLGNYSVALNHLLNELHFICCFIEKEDIIKYKSTSVDNFLHNRHIENADRIKVRNLFDRRNNNTVSHPGDDDRIAWGVGENEYFMYKKTVASVLSKIL